MYDMNLSGCDKYICHGSDGRHLHSAIASLSMVQRWHDGLSPKSVLLDRSQQTNWIPFHSRQSHGQPDTSADIWAKCMAIIVHVGAGEVPSWMAVCGSPSLKRCHGWGVVQGAIDLLPLGNRYIERIKNGMSYFLHSPDLNPDEIFSWCSRYGNAHAFSHPSEKVSWYFLNMTWAAPSQRSRQLREAHQCGSLGWVECVVVPMDECPERQQILDPGCTGVKTGFSITVLS
jgi:hypothetical protein